MWLLLLLFPPRLEISQQLGTHGAPGYARTLFLEPKKTSPQQGKRRSSNFSSSDHLSYFKTRKGDCRIPWTKPPKAWMHNAWYTVFLPLLHTLKVELACGGSLRSMHKHGALVKSEVQRHVHSCPLKSVFIRPTESSTLYFLQNNAGLCVEASFILILVVLFTRGSTEERRSCLYMHSLYPSPLYCPSDTLAFDLLMCYVT